MVQNFLCLNCTVALYISCVSLQKLGFRVGQGFCRLFIWQPWVWKEKLLFLKKPGKSLEFCIPKSVQIDKIHICCVVLLFHKERDLQVHLSCWFCVISSWGIKQLRNSRLFCSQSIDSDRKQNNTQNINKVWCGKL